MNQTDSLTCHRCFKDKALIDFIRREGRRGWCDWCGARNVFIIPSYELGDIFRDAVSIYQPGDGNDDTISYLFQEDWNIFSGRIEQAPDDLMQRLMVNILKAGIDHKDYPSGDYPDYDGYFRRKDAWLVEHWHEKAEAYFVGGRKNMRETLLSSGRRIDPIDDLPDQLETAFEDLSHTYDPGHILYRARIHENRYRNDWFNLSEVSVPPSDKARAGRANRRDEPVLYLADNAETALAEVRAWKGMAVAIARFEVKKQLSVVSLLNYQLPESPFFQESLEWKVQLAILFDRLAEELSLPVLPDEDEKIYFSSQYLCDWVKKSGYEGIEYPSAMGSGFNVAIFNFDNIEPLDVQYVRIKQIKHSYDQLDEDEPLYDESPFGYLFKT